MGCLCFSEPKTDDEINTHLHKKDPSGLYPGRPRLNPDKGKVASIDGQASSSITANTFRFRDLAAATKNFREDFFLGEGGFGKVYKGQLETINQTVAIKQLNPHGWQGNREFIVEVLMLSLLHHPNLVNLIGYCAEGEQRLLVYEYMPFGSLADHLYDLPSGKKPLDWNTRMKIAVGAARGLEYLHNKAKPPVIYRDLKAPNILLDENYHILTISGSLRLDSEHKWVLSCMQARPLFKDRAQFLKMADPAMQGQYPSRNLYQAISIAAMCVQEQPSLRPVIGDVVTALSYLASTKQQREARQIRNIQTSSGDTELGNLSESSSNK
ncbi:hypothetical protein V2J09_006750 [Rumex salicifolius]